MERLRQHLNVVLSPEQIEPWDDRSRDTSKGWKTAREDALGHASIVLLLVSADLLSSDYVREQLMPLLERKHADGLPVIPLVVKPSNYKKAIPWLAGIAQRPFGDLTLQSLTEAQADQALSDLAGEVADILERVGTQT
jgi:hypothetical protein